MGFVWETKLWAGAGEGVHRIRGNPRGLPGSGVPNPTSRTSLLASGRLTPQATTPPHAPLPASGDSPSVLLPSSPGWQPRGKFLPGTRRPGGRGGVSGSYSATPPTTHTIHFHPSSPPTLVFLPKGQRLARLRPWPRSSGRPSEGVPRLLSEGARFIGWLKSSNSTSPGLTKPDLCSSMRSWES